MNVNERIRQYIKENGMNIRFVAKRAGYDYQKLTRQLGNKQNITTDEYEQICRDGLKVDPAYFFDPKFLDSKNKSA